MKKKKKEDIYIYTGLYGRICFIYVENRRSWLSAETAAARFRKKTNKAKKTIPSF